MSQYLPYLFFLACPISMALMMWMMMRRDHGHGQAPRVDPRIAELESQVIDLRMSLRHTELAEIPERLPVTAPTVHDLTMHL